MNTELSQPEREALEIDFWKREREIQSAEILLDNFVNKVSEIPMFYSEVRKFTGLFGNSNTVLEIGGGELWASCLVKKMFPHLTVIGTDISGAAIKFRESWENMIGSRIDSAFSCTSYDVPLEDHSVDIMFAFQAAHHFGDHEKTFREAKRVIKKGGHLLYLAEPVCSRLTYKMAFNRVNAIRPEVPEDLLVLGDISKMAERSGFTIEFSPRTELINPSLARLSYYKVLDTLPILRTILPNAMSIKFQST